MADASSTGHTNNNQLKVYKEGATEVTIWRNHSERTGDTWCTATVVALQSQELISLHIRWQV